MLFDRRERAEASGRGRKDIFADSLNGREPEAGTRYRKAMQAVGEIEVATPGRGLLEITARVMIAGT